MKIKKWHLVSFVFGALVLIVGCLVLFGGCEKNERIPKLLRCEYINDATIDQLARPCDGEEVAVLTVKNYGVIKCRLFPEVAEKAVTNFKRLAEGGKYDGVSFHRVIENFMIQTGGENDSIYGGGFEVELNEKVHHFNGALCVARSGSKKNGQACQFYIVSSNEGKNADLDEIAKQVNKTYKDEGFDVKFQYSDEAKENYKNLGGSPKLDMQYTVFGQVFEGQDVVEKIASCKKKETKYNVGEQSEPEEEIILEKVEIVNYQNS